MSDDDLSLFDRFTVLRFPRDIGRDQMAEGAAVPGFSILLISRAQIQSEQDFDGNPQEDGSYRIRITPEVTTFSDDIVVSYPSFDDETSVPHNVPKHLRFEAHWAKFMCQDGFDPIASRSAAGGCPRQSIPFGTARR